MVNNKELHSILTRNSTYFVESLGKKHQNRLINLIQEFLLGKKKHKDRFSRMEYINTQSLSRKELSKLFGGNSKRKSYYKNVIPHYFDCVDEIYNKTKNGYTKKYKLKKWILDEVDKYLDDC